METFSPLTAANKFVVVTTINKPNRRVLEYRDLGYDLVVIGDRKTDDATWSKFANNEGIDYLGLDRQNEYFPTFSKILPINSYARKNLGYLRAISRGADLIWETDDDTFPRPEVGDPLSHLESRKTLTATSGQKLWNPYSHFASGEGLWPRGYPLSQLKYKDQVIPLGEPSGSPLDIIQTLVNREPDVDAIYRLTVSDQILDFRPNSDLVSLPAMVMAPGNTQSTFWLNSRLFNYLYFPSTVSNRFADILKLYVSQTACRLGYGGFLTEQFRNAHDYLTDFAEEVSMYTSVEKVLKTLEALEGADILAIYRELVNIGVCSVDELTILESFIWELGEISSS